MKTLVAYYSLSGNTKYIAEAIAGQLSADLFEIKPEKELPAEGFKKFFFGGMSAIFGSHPKLKNGSIDLSAYQNILLGTPIWAGTCSAPVNSFIKQNKFSNKKIALFACHASEEPDSAKKGFEKLKKELAGNQFAGEQDFRSPLTHDKEQNAEKAVQWAAGLKF